MNDKHGQVFKVMMPFLCISLIYHINILFIEVTNFSILSGFIHLISIERNVCAIGKLDSSIQPSQSTVFNRKRIFGANEAIIAFNDFNILTLILAKDFSQDTNSRCNLRTVRWIDTIDEDFIVVRNYLYSILICLSNRQQENLTLNSLQIATKLHKAIINELRHIHHNAMALTIDIFKLNSPCLNEVIDCRSVFLLDIDDR